MLTVHWIYTSFLIRIVLTSLKVYKLEKKYEPDGDGSYLSYAHLKQNLGTRLAQKLNGGACGGLIPLPKDVFTVQTTLASTKLTQNEGRHKIMKVSIC